MAATMLTPGDAVLAVSSTGRTIDLISSVKPARNARAAVIGIALSSSPLALRCDVPFEISVDEDTDV